MDAGDIEHYLTLVGEELEGMGLREPIQLLLIGAGICLHRLAIGQ
jgi:hypothetical protein